MVCEQCQVEFTGKFFETKQKKLVCEECYIQVNLDAETAMYVYHGNQALDQMKELDVPMATIMFKNGDLIVCSEGLRKLGHKDKGQILKAFAVYLANPADRDET